MLTLNHELEQSHHHHKHANTSHHVGGHHLMQVENLNISFTMYESDARSYFNAKQVQSNVIHDLCIGVHSGEIVAIVGASGSGKTLLADSLMGHFEPNATVTGSIWFDGDKMDAASLKKLRGHGISLVPQSVNFLDPLIKVGKQVQGFTKSNSIKKCADKVSPKNISNNASSISNSDDANNSDDVSNTGNTNKARRFFKEHRAQRAKLQAKLFERYNLNSNVASLYPFELSGGMARRVLLCCALMDNPKVIIADEPTPGLDLELAKVALADFRQFANDGGGVLLITHDIELALSVADRVAVFYDGTVVEETAVANFANPDLLSHPFSKALWHALPEHDFFAPTGGDALS
ncbi:MAG: ATP-binding cassette domain-containing protein [Coriobacteriales bacterium]|nr:ATP-binding cassette domain-containing protein [Coriobacteriales bacterium]